jgi:hypothetical protein
MLILFAALLLTAAARADDVPEKYRPAVEKGLAWLVKQQHKDGHWDAAGQYPVAMTGLAGIALAAEGSTPTKGKYAQQLRRAAAWLIGKSQKGTPHDGLIGTLDIPGDSGRYLFGHGYAVTFLSMVLDGLDAEMRRRAKDVLNRAVQFSVRAQTKRGGWGYVSAKEGSDFDEGASSMVHIQALRAAQAAGIPVPAAALKSAFKYAEDLTTDRGGLRYSLSSGGGSGGERPPLTAAALGVGAAAGADSVMVKKWHKYCATAIAPVGGRSGFDEFTVCHYAPAIYALGEEGWAKLFPESKQAERIVWSTYRTMLFDQLMRAQQADGSWNTGSTGVGPIYGTAINVTVLQLDKGHLPIQRR